MSKQAYLKDEEKEKVLDLIKKYLAFRLTDEEILENLKTKEIKISDRTLRRYKQEIKEDAGSTFFLVFKKLVMENVYQDILMYEEIQKQCWKLFSETTSLPQKLRALSCLRGSSSDKLRLLHNIPKSGGYLTAHGSKFSFSKENEKAADKTKSGHKQHLDRLKETKEIVTLGKSHKKHLKSNRSGLAETLLAQQKLLLAAKNPQTK